MIAVFGFGIRRGSGHVFSLSLDGVAGFGRSRSAILDAQFIRFDPPSGTKMHMG